MRPGRRATIVAHIQRGKEARLIAAVADGGRMGMTDIGLFPGAGDIGGGATRAVWAKVAVLIMADPSDFQTLMARQKPNAGI